MHAPLFARAPLRARPLVVLLLAAALTTPARAGVLDTFVRNLMRSGYRALGFGIQAVTRVARRGQVIQQRHLRGAWTEATTRRGLVPEKFVKPTNIAYPIPREARGLADLPPRIREVLGQLDKTKYTDAYVAEKAAEGSHVILQRTADGALDFYISSGSMAKYEAAVPDAALRAEASELAGYAGGQVEFIRKAGVTEMLPAASLGVPLEIEARVFQAWGETQSKAAGSSAWIVRNADDSYYIVQAENGTGLPVGYVRATTVAPGAAPGGNAASEAFSQAEDGLTGILGN